jgi:hypothetical protein
MLASHRMRLAVLPTVALLFGSACGPAQEREEEEAVLTLESELGSACPSVKKFEPGTVSTAEDEGRIVFSPDRKTLYFHRFLEAEGRLAILQSQRGSSGWSTPVVASFSGPFNDLDAFVTGDGQRLYFASDRPTDGSGVARPDWELWYVSRTPQGWSAPVHISGINTSANELFPTVTADGSLYFNSDREGGYGAWDIYRARRQGAGFAAAENVGPGVTTDAWEFNPAVDPTGNVLLFGSIGRPDTLGGADIYASVRLGGTWQSAKNLGPCINTAAEEFHPSFSVSHPSLYFIRTSPTTAGDVFEVKFRFP